MMGLIDHPLTPLIVEWMQAKLRFASYCTEDNRHLATIALDRLNAALEGYPGNPQPASPLREIEAIREIKELADGYTVSGVSKIRDIAARLLSSAPPEQPAAANEVET